ncbi:matrix extracellular phosphoglycoprotein [Apteryx mantelli]|uniref:Matrix extracellular phosphoglycoprotein n=1 Tax=Apteryx mantelli TaxID=2696672 RepID=A0ABM4EK78_9AVES
MLIALLCVCLASTAFSTPVPLPLSRKAGENCVGQHQILLKGCNVKHGFYVFKYVYSFSTRRNQTQVKKEEASAQSNVSRPQPSEEEALRKLTEGGAAGGRGDDDSSLPERAGPENGGSSVEGGQPPSTAGHAGSGEARRPGAGGGVGSDASLAPGTEGSGDSDFLDRVESDVLVLPQRPVTAPREHESTWEGADGARSEADGLGELEAAGERNGSRAGEAAGDGHEDEWAREVVTTGHQLAGGPAEDTAVGAEAEGSGDAGVLGAARGRGHGPATMGGAAFTSITENAEDVEVDAAGVDEYTYIPDAGAVTITRGVTQAGRTGLAQIPTKEDDEVNIFIGKANIHVGEQEIATERPGDDDHDTIAATVGAGGHLPTPGTTEVHDGGQSTPTSGRDGGEAQGVATTVGHSDRDGPTEGHGPAATMVQPEGDGDGGDGDGDDGDSDDGGATTAPQQGEGDCTTAGREAADRPGPGGSHQVRLRPTGPRGQQEGTGLPKSPQGKDGAGASQGTAGDGGEMPVVRQDRVTEASGSSHGGGEPARPRPPAQAPLGDGVAGHETARGHSMVLAAAPTAGARHGDAPRSPGQRGNSGEARGGSGGGRGRLGAPPGRRPGSGVARVYEAYGRSRRVDQMRRADELRVRERSVYAFGQAARPAAPGGAHLRRSPDDSSQSSEPERGSRSDSRQEGDGSWGREGWRHP